MTKCGIAALQASSTAMPRQAIFLNIKLIEYLTSKFDISCSTCLRATHRQIFCGSEKLLIKPIITMATVSGVSKNHPFYRWQVIYVLPIYSPYAMATVLYTRWAIFENGRKAKSINTKTR